MFTGIVEELGRVVSREVLPEEAARLTLHGPTAVSDAVHGASIAVNGVCLTVVEFDASEGWFRADVMRESLLRSSLGALQAGDPVNLERPVTLSDRLGGHLVQGHVDGTATIRSRTPSQHWEVVEFALEPGLARYIVEKGSITIDGVSLTVVGVGDQDGADSWFSVSLIPTTLELTTLGRKQIGDIVNIEVDVVAKYVERLLSWRTS